MAVVPARLHGEPMNVPVPLLDTVTLSAWLDEASDVSVGDRYCADSR